MFENLTLAQLVFGRLTWEAIPYDPIIRSTFVAVVIGGLAIVGLITKYKLWGYLWREWFTSVDHKKIGIMYIVRIHPSRAAGFWAPRVVTSVDGDR
jgi:cytochrome o ubiquinol oxidase subunit I